MKRSYLTEIMQWHRRRAAEDMQKRDPDESLDLALAEFENRPSYKFSAALSVFGIIAELKKRSPSKGSLRTDMDPAQIAGEFEEAGAACLSVLTDQKFFGGSLDDLKITRDAVSLPILRKDFTCSVLDICDAFWAGAQAVLLIMSALDDSEAREYSKAAGNLGLDAIFEIHTEQELERVLEAAEPDFPLCILVNQRNLNTFAEYSDRALELASKIPESATSIAASAVKSSENVKSLKASGYNAVLIGEYLMRSESPAQALRELVASV